MRTADSAPTSELWSVTNAALIAGRWSVARSLLETLARRPDYCDQLSSAAQYERVAGKPLGAAAQLLQDRIDAVNARADRNLFAGPGQSF